MSKDHLVVLVAAILVGGAILWAIPKVLLVLICGTLLYLALRSHGRAPV